MRSKTTPGLRTFIKRCPLWLTVFVVDMIIFLVLHYAGSHICGGTSSCYYIKDGVDRFTNYLALIVAVMAILIPVSIELWKGQYQSHNLGQKSLLDKEWENRTRNRYLHEPLGSIGAFTVISMFLPLFIIYKE